jgi:hypothetical protein
VREPGKPTVARIVGAAQTQAQQFTDHFSIRPTGHPQDATEQGHRHRLDVAQVAYPAGVRAVPTSYGDLQLPQSRV